MAQLIKDWNELKDLESELYKIELDYIGDDPVAGWIVPKEETDDTSSSENYLKHHVYLSTHTFYGANYQESTETLQKYGFDVEIDNWDKDKPEPEINYKRAKDLTKLTTNQRKIKEFKEKANRPDASDNDVKKLIRACGGDVDKAVSLIKNS